MNVAENGWAQLRALGELLQLESEGLSLPYPAHQIIHIEANGGVVDLDTGEILWGAADTHTFTLTEEGKIQCAGDA